MDKKDLPGKGDGAQQPRKSKKRQPRGLPILFEDKHILVVNKPSGLLTFGTDREKCRYDPLRVPRHLRNPMVDPAGLY